MRLHLGILAAVLVATLSACGGGSSPKDAGATGPSSPSSRLSSTSPSNPLSNVAIPCTKFSDTAAKILAAEGQLYSGSGAPDALKSLSAALKDLKDGAPADVQSALDDLAAAFTQAEALIKDSSDSAKAQLSALAPKLSADSQKLTAYIVSKCKG